MKSGHSKPPKRLGPSSRHSSWLVRPVTFKMAIAILRVVDWVARVYDWYRR